MSILTEVVGVSKIQATIILEITSGILLLESFTTYTTQPIPS